MYRTRRSGCLACVYMKFCNVTDMYTFATVGENAAPMDVPFICWNTRDANSKKWKLTQVCNSLMMRFGSKRMRCLFLYISSYIICNISVCGTDGYFG